MPKAKKKKVEENEQSENAAAEAGVAEKPLPDSPAKPQAHQTAAAPVSPGMKELSGWRRVIREAKEAWRAARRDAGRAKRASERQSMLLDKHVAGVARALKRKGPYPAGKGELRIANAEARYWGAVVRSHAAEMMAEKRHTLMLELEISAKDAQIARLCRKLRLARRR